MTEIHITDPTPFDDDSAVEKSLRPSQFDEFIGQKELVDNLKLYIEAANTRGDALDHVLLFGPPGLGKTTLANIVSKELKSNIKQASGPVVERAGDLAGLITNLCHRDVFFIDEVHRLSSVVEEYLYSALEDYKIDIMIETGPNARSVQLNLNPFTLVGATTRSGFLTNPMRARFAISNRLEHYRDDLLSKIVERSSSILDLKIDKTSCFEIAKRSRGTPRIANSLLRRVRDFAQVEGEGNIDIQITKSSLKSLNVDKNGLDEMDNKILSTIIDKYNGGPVGISTLSTSLSENVETIEEVYEPFLIQQGFIIRTPRGREVTEKGYKHLGKNKNNQSGLFN